MTKINWLLLIGVVFTGLFSACSDSYLPKRRGFHKIDLPTPQYIVFENNYPYSIQTNSIAKVKPDTTKYAEQYWVDVYYPQFDADVQLTYKPLGNNANNLTKLIVDSRNLVNKHQVKASGIEEGRLLLDNGSYAYLFELQGEVPSQFQFYTTDSANHFIRGALYFKTASKNDSLAPVIKYIANDMKHLLKTLKWKKVK
jgi:gliding motility-associated lipoprotein GldD